MSFLTTRNGEIARSFLDPIEKTLALGLTPLIHGDLVFDLGRGISIVSADRIAALLALQIKGARVLFGCDVDGVFSDNPRMNPDARLIEVINDRNAGSVKRRLQRTKLADATESMFGKVREALKLARQGHETLIFNLTIEGNLNQALSGKRLRCTRFVSSKPKKS